MNTIRKSVLIPCSIALSLGGGIPAAFAGDEADAKMQADAQQESEFSGQMRDAWLDGKLETAFLLNTELNSFDINTTVNDGQVVLSGDVESEIQAELATEIAKSIEGVTDVSNNLELAESKDASKGDRKPSKLMMAVENATAAAVLKTRLLTNDQVEGLNINVDVQGGVATLRGEVGSEAEKQLAGYIAGNVRGISKVANELTISQSS